MMGNPALAVRFAGEERAQAESVLRMPPAAPVQMQVNSPMALPPGYGWVVPTHAVQPTKHGPRYVPIHWR